MSDIDIQDDINAAINLTHALRLMSEGLGRSDEASAICAVSNILASQLGELRDRLEARKEIA